MRWPPLIPLPPFLPPWIIPRPPTTGGGNMQAVVITIIMSILELIDLWGGWNLGITREWIETILMVLTPILVWIGVSR
jgi:hypothetical protein